MIVCRLLGHRYRFRTRDEVMHWTCQRCGAIGGAKAYLTTADARRYARAFDREDRDALGRRAPLIGLFPLRLVHALRSARRRQRAAVGARRS